MTITGGPIRERLAPYKRVRRLEFGPLPKTVSGKIRRVDLRAREQEAYDSGQRGETIEYRDSDFPALREAASGSS